MPTLTGIRARLGMIRDALVVPWDRINAYPRSTTGLFEFLAPLLPHIPPVPDRLHSVILPDAPDAGLVESSELEVARTLYTIAMLLNSRSLVEIGVFRGSTSRFLAAALADQQGGTLHLVDVDSTALANARRSIGDVAQVTVIEHAGFSTSSAVLAGVSSGCDLVYLDADHSEDGVRAELACWIPKVRPGGVVAVHDTIGIRGVCRAVNEYAAMYPVLTLSTGRGCGLSLIRVAGSPVTTR
jgi:predicted O-methyltransferase YrrM